VASRYWTVYGKPIRDKLVDLVQARVTADSVEVGEIMAGLGRARHSFQSSGIYVLPPGLRPLNGQENTPTDANETEMSFPVVCRCEDFTEADYLEQLGQLTGVVVDAIEATPFFGVTSSGGAATVEQAYILEVERPVIADADGESPAFAVQVVHVVCKVCRSTAKPIHALIIDAGVSMVVDLVRVTGGLQETLLLAGGATIATTRDKPFRCPEADAAKLLEDKTGRFQVAPADAAPSPAAAVDVEDLEDPAPDGVL
jgi:hypothetical protein